MTDYASQAGIAIANELIATRQMLKTAQQQGSVESWEAVLAEPGVWSLRHESDDDYSVANMADVEIRQSLIEDLLFVAVETYRGAAGYYPLSQATRHLGDKIDQVVRINSVVSSMLSIGCICQSQDGTLTIHPDFMKEAEDFCGVYVLDWDNDDMTDMIDDIISVGGAPLLSETIDDLLNRAPE